MNQNTKNPQNNKKNDQKNDLEMEESATTKLLKIASRQLTKADQNRDLLELGTLRLKSLNMTSMDIDNELKKSEIRIRRIKNDEEREIWMVYVAFVVFLVVCIGKTE